MKKPVNIWSGHQGPEAALTNPTVLAKRKGGIDRDYPVVFRGKRYLEAEAAYHAHSGELPFEERQELCFQVVAAKLEQYPELVALITDSGGVPWLESCSHFTYAKTGGFRRWEGNGRHSAFLRALIRAYEAVLAGTVAKEVVWEQASLFE